MNPQSEILRPRLRAAIAMRKKNNLPGSLTDAFRMVHDRYDGLDGLVIERLGEQADIRLRDGRWANVESANTILDELAEHGIVGARFVDDRPRKHDYIAGPEDVGAEHLNTLAAERNMQAAAEPFVVSEYGRRFEISLHDGFSHGLFFDMRRVRADLAVRWQQRKVANLFAYTCSFSVYLAPSNEVVNVDVSKKYLDWGRRNHELNGLPTEGAFVARDAFEFLEIAKKRQHQWDAIIIDPPAYSRGKAGKSREFSLRKSLVPLIHEALDVLRPGGELFLSTNLAELEQHTFRSLVDRAAREHGSRLVKQWGPDIDYPAPAEEFHLKTALVVKR